MFISFPTTFRGPSLLPTDVPNCAIWLDASRKSTISLSGSNVTQWNDLSGNSRNASQGTGANQPTFSATGFSAQPLPAVVFNKTTTFLSFANSLSLTQNLGGMTCFAVCSVGTPSSSSNQNVFFSSTAGSTNVRFDMFFTPTNTFLSLSIRRQDADATDIASDSVSRASTSIVACTQVDYSLPALTGYINGNLQFTKTTGTTTGLTSNTASNVAPTLGQGLIAGSCYGGGIAEFIFYQRALTLNEISAVNRYLGLKWGVSVI